MMLRQWKGLVKDGFEQSYIDHLKNETFPSLMKLDGFLKAQISYNQKEKGCQFCISTQWESLDSIRAFAGIKLNEAVVPDKVQLLMIEYDKYVSHFNIEYEIDRRNFE